MGVVFLLNESKPDLVILLGQSVCFQELELWTDIEVLLGERSWTFNNWYLSLETRSMEVVIEFENEGFIVMNAVEFFKRNVLFDLIASGEESGLILGRQEITQRKENKQN